MSHLHPKDLLELSRSARHLHSLLMTIDASPYWRAARRGIDLPDGPPTINEAQYASLMFEQKCTVSTRRGRCRECCFRHGRLTLVRRVELRIRTSDLLKRTLGSVTFVTHSSMSSTGFSSIG